MTWRQLYVRKATILCNGIINRIQLRRFIIESMKYISYVNLRKGISDCDLNLVKLDFSVLVCKQTIFLKMKLELLHNIDLSNWDDAASQVFQKMDPGRAITILWKDHE